MSALSVTCRWATATLFALLLAVRLLSPAGFMPTFDHGSIAIVLCPDGEPAAAAMTHHHHHGDPKLQQRCPYAAGAAPATSSDFAGIVAVLLTVAALLSFQSFEALIRRLHDRPPLRGPPLPA